MSKAIDWLDQNEVFVRTAFRAIVMALLIVCIFRIEEAIDTADSAYRIAHEANDNAKESAENAEEAKNNAEVCKELRFR